MASSSNRSSKTKSVVDSAGGLTGVELEEHGPAYVEAVQSFTSALELQEYPSPGGGCRKSFIGSLSRDYDHFDVPNHFDQLATDVVDA